MIVYQANKAEFSNDVLDDRIDSKIHEFFRRQLNRSTSSKEIASWRNSMQYMDRVLNDSAIPDDCGVAIEYQLPQSAKRLDFIITGQGEGNEEYAILVELKQWSEASLSSKDGVVNTYVGNRVGEHTHPSYQAWSYASLLQNFNETITEENIRLQPCAYLHNYVADEVIAHEHYKEYIEKAPLFLKGEAARLRDFIKQFVRYGDKNNILYRIDNGKIRPSKMLADNMASMIKGNKEFVMIDEQKLVYEEALALTAQASDRHKKVLIVKGGPGTGKSVVAINLLVEITKRGMLTQYISKNAAPRAVYENKLTGSLKKSVISNLFSGSGAFIGESKNNVFDTLVVDEAHRLNEKSGLYANLGENQVKELIRAAKCTVFFIDEDQRVTLNDIGTVDEIRKWADKAGAEVKEMELASQFRCNGSDGYLAWLDHMLQIRETANTTLDGIDYDFKVFADPNELRAAIEE
ncbi:MAG TPA: DNA/RNA helicase domain-containing protein, partial [Chitinophagaceae bacterium]|nr:DNA/RNA helicase domain-containing protein [Chitinophagaceae bacterium]